MNTHAGTAGCDFTIGSEWLNQLMAAMTGGHGSGGHRHRGRSRSGRGWEAPVWGWFGPRGAGGRPGGGRRAGRGEVRGAILLLLAEQPRHGYDIITEIAARSEGQWRPSPGSVYPVLAQLEGEGLVQAEESNSRKVFQLTEAGVDFVAENRERLGEPWAMPSEPDQEVLRDLMESARDAATAVWQVGQAGDDQQLAEAVEVLAETRRRLYGILAREEKSDADPSSLEGDRTSSAEGDETASSEADETSQ